MMTGLHALADAWAGLFGPALLQNTAFLAFLLLALHALKGAPAAWRHGLALLGLAKLLTPPLFPLPLQPPAPAPVTGGLLGLEWLTRPVAGTPAPAAASFDPVTLLGRLWRAGALLNLLAPLIATARLARNLRDAAPLAGAQLGGLELPAGIGLYRSPRISLPLTLGLFPRRVFVPADWEAWSMHHRRLFLHHEIAHLRRADGLLQLVELLARSLWFFHPLAWLLSGRLHEFREMACDDRSLAPERESAPAYARYLMEAAETGLRTSGSIDTASALLGRRRTLLKRVDYQMKGGGLMTISKWKLAGALAGMLALFLALSWALPGGQALAGKDGKDEEAVKVIKKPLPPGMEAKGITVTLHGQGKMDMDGHATDIVTFNKKFLGLGEEAPFIKVKCADTLPMGELFAFHQLFVERGMTKIAYVGGPEPWPSDLTAQHDMQAKLAELPKERVTTVTVAAGGERLLDGKAMPMAKIVAKLGKRLEADPKLVVLVETEAETAYSDFLAAYSELQGAGAKKVAMLPPKGWEQGDWTAR